MAPLLRYALRRLAQALVVLGIVIVLQFLLLHMAPGDVADVIAGESQASDPAFVQQLRSELGLDRPLPCSCCCTCSAWSRWTGVTRTRWTRPCGCSSPSACRPRRC